VWDIRNRGVIPPGALPRVRAFTESLQGVERAKDGLSDQDSEKEL
jgi:hypothetical protein